MPHVIAVLALGGAIAVVGQVNPYPAVEINDQIVSIVRGVLPAKDIRIVDTTVSPCAHCLPLNLKKGVVIWGDRPSRLYGDKATRSNVTFAIEVNLLGVPFIKKLFLERDAVPAFDFQRWRLTRIENLSFREELSVPVLQRHVPREHVSSSLRLSNALGFINGLLGSDSGALGVSRSSEGGSESQDADSHTAQAEPESAPGPIGGFLGGVRSLPLGAKIGITIVFTMLAWLFGTVGFYRTIGRPVGWKRDVYLYVLMVGFFLSPGVMWW
ncbi:MAG: hypothetical protein JWL86_2696 [Rhizobium sp.]|nr:hypothetical protein [Rhizobium sp.]